MGPKSHKIFKLLWLVKFYPSYSTVLYFFYTKVWKAWTDYSILRLYKLIIVPRLGWVRLG